MIRVYIATTQGPVAIQQLRQEDPAVRSVVCLDGTADTLPISRAYDNFVKTPTGVIQRHYGHPTYRMDVAARISDGNSWQLGTFVAHALDHEELLAAPEDTVDTVLWLSGEVDQDLNVRPVEHIEDKLRLSQSFFQEMRAKNIRVMCYIPSGQGHIPDDAFLEALGVDGELLQLEAVRSVGRIMQRFSLKDPTAKPLESLDAALDPLDAALEDDDTAAPDSPIDLYKNKSPYRENLRHKIIGLGVAVLLVATGLSLQYYETVESLRVDNLEIGIAEIHSQGAETCATATSFERTPLSLTENVAPVSLLGSLCAIDVTLTNHGAPQYLWAFAHRIEDGHFLLADRDDLLDPKTRQGTIGWRLTLPDYLLTDLNYRIVALAADRPLAPAIEQLTQHLYSQTTFNWSPLQADLEANGITVLSVRHTLERP